MKKILFRCTVMVLGLIALLSQEKPLSASQTNELPSSIIFILDASGSMWGQVDGKPKIAIAKEVMKTLINDLPDKNLVGIVAYGHRSKGDCDDVEDLVPLGPINREELSRKIDAIHPKGMTPITLSVQRTAEKLRSVEYDSTIILVSDGKETCKGDPCALVKELKESGVKFVMHVIGFDVTEEERAQLECMARVGGGTYFTAKTAGDLQGAAKKAVEPLRKGGTLRVIALREGKPFSAEMAVFRAGERERLFLTPTVTDQNDKGTELAAGIYDLKVVDTQNQMRPEIAVTGLRVEDGKMAEKSLDFSGGSLLVKVIKNKKPSLATLVVTRAGMEEKVAESDTSVENPQTLRLSVGTYDVRVTDGAVSPPVTVTLSGVSVTPGGAVEKTVDLSEGRLKVRVLKQGQPRLAFVKIFKAGTQKEVTAGDTSVGNPEEFQLLPGVYDIRVIDDEGDPPQTVALEGVVIEGNQTVEKTAEFK